MTEHPLSVLVIDDSPDDRMLCRQVLREAFGDLLNLSEESTGESGLEAIATAEPDCVLLDYSLPGRDGIEVLRRIRTTHPYLSVVLLTGQGSESIAVQSVKEGAQDYITKAEITPDTLSRAVRMAIERCALRRRIDQQHEVLEVFSRALAHDLREPVRTIRAFAHAICEGEVEGDERDDYIRHIRDAGARMGTLIDSVLAYTQIESMGPPRHEVFRLDEAVASARDNLSVLFRERGTTLRVEALPDVTASRVQVIQVLQNLMSNAASHAPRPVTIVITAEQDGEQARVVVRDDGPGIAPEDLARIFEPFRRLGRGEGHCGLGLSICKKIIEAHGGVIGCESDLGAGARVYFTLPGAPAAIVPARAESGEHAARPAGAVAIANVLLVDDRADDLDLARSFLSGRRGMRCNFLVANDGREGLAIMRDRARAKDRVDLVLLDINMPVMNGFEMLEMLARDPELRHTPVVMCTGSTWEKEKDRARALGAIDYLIKPVFFKDLKPVVARSAAIRLVDQASGPPVLVRVD